MCKRHVQVIPEKVRRDDKLLTVDAAVDGVAAEFCGANSANNVVTGYSLVE